jgi:hypothetical protein
MAVVARCRRRGWADACAKPATERDRQHQLAAGLMINVYRIPAVKNRSVSAPSTQAYSPRIIMTPHMQNRREIANG